MAHLESPPKKGIIKGGIRVKNHNFFSYIFSHGKQLVCQKLGVSIGREKSWVDVKNFWGLCEPVSFIRDLTFCSSCKVYLILIKNNKSQ